MLPPETMQTISRLATRPDEAAASASAPAPSAITRARSASRRIAAAASSSDDRERAVEQRRASSHIFGSTPGAGSVDERGRVLDRLARLARRERGSHRRAGLRLDRVDLRLGPQRRERAGDPGEETAAAPRDEHRVGIGKLLEDLEADRAVAGHHPLVLDGVHEEAVDALEPRLDDRLPPALVGHLDDAPAEALDRVELRLRRVSGTMIVPARRAPAPPRPRPAPCCPRSP